MLCERDLSSSKCCLESEREEPFQLTCHVVRDISWMLTVAPIRS